MFKLRTLIALLVLLYYLLVLGLSLLYMALKLMILKRIWVYKFRRVLKKYAVADELIDELVLKYKNVLRVTFVFSNLWATIRQVSRSI